MKKLRESYFATLVACCSGMLVMAACSNLTPLLFIPLQEQYGLTFSQLGLLVLINFVTQVACDVLFSKAVDKHGFRPFVTTAQFLCVAGFLLFALTPTLFPGNEYAGFVISTILFSGTAGLCELLLSPIIDMLPLGNKTTLMPLMHSFYAWGQVVVIVVTTTLLLLCGRTSWPYIVAGWAVVPLITFVLFCFVPLRNKAEEIRVMRIRDLLKKPLFWIAVGAIAFGGAAEVSMNQWISAYMESVIALPKMLGDMVGMCGFAVMLGLGRLAYGIFGERFPLQKMLIFGSFTAAACYLLVAVSPFDWLTLAAGALCGFCTSLLWPGTLVAASSKLPTAGASLFALLAAAGDFGAAAGPSAMGGIAEVGGLPLAFVISALIPLLCGVCHIVMKRLKDQPNG